MMPYVSDTEWNDFKRKVEVLEQEVEKLRHVKGQPIIQAYAGKKLDLNENINAVNLMRKLKPFAVGSECTDLASVIELANLIRAGGLDNGIYTEE